MLISSRSLRKGFNPPLLPKELRRMLRRTVEKKIEGEAAMLSATLRGR